MRRNRSQILVHKGNKREKRYHDVGVPKDLSSVCINRSLGGIGDVLMATVGLREFKRENPDTKLYFAIDQSSTYDNTYYKLVKNAPFLDGIVDSKYVRRSRYTFYKDITSVCIQEENSSDYPRGRVEIFAKAMHVKELKNTIPFYKESNEEEAASNKVFEKYKNKTKIFIHTASNDAKRSYSIKNTVELVSLIESKMPNTVVFVSDFNKLYNNWNEFENVVNVSELDIRETASYIKRCNIFVGPDSGLMHLAAAVETKSLVIFGAIPPETRIRYYPTHKSISLESLPCLGCWYKACPFDSKCMKDLKASAVFEKMKRMI